jgi:hypothetical protein
MKRAEHFFHNSNDFLEGFRRTAGVPEYTYVLGFSPSNVKLDGKFHTLKVTLNSREKLVLTARRGYFAPTQDTSAEDTAKREIDRRSSPTAKPMICPSICEPRR